MENDSVETTSCVRGYHVYYCIWEAAVGDQLNCERELDNVKDRYAVAVKKDGTVIGHLLGKYPRFVPCF